MDSLQSNTVQSDTVRHDTVRRPARRSWRALVVGAIGATVSIVAGATGSVAADGLHCPDHNGHPAKVEHAEAYGDLVFEAGTLFCLKKGAGNSGQLTADGTTSVYEYLVAAGIDGEPGEGPSYYIVYHTPGPQQPPAGPEPVAPLLLTFMRDCPDASVEHSDGGTARWRVRNANAVDVDYTFRAAGDAVEPGTGTAPPGDSFFTTAWVDGGLTVIVEWENELGDVRSDTKARGEALPADHEKCDQPEPEPEPSMRITALAPVCVADVPFIDYAATVEGIDPSTIDEVRLVFRDSGGGHVETRTVGSLSGRTPFPGAIVDAEGNPTKWPGWKFEHGSWVHDPSDAILRDGLSVTIEVNPSATANVAYPDATEECAGPGDDAPTGGQTGDEPGTGDGVEDGVEDSVEDSVEDGIEDGIEEQEQLSPVPAPSDGLPPAEPAGPDADVAQLPPPAAPAAEPVIVLPATGSGTAVTAAAGLAALLGGLALLAASRRRAGDRIV